ncbi:uncharacterized protein LOC126742827 [Anthonomus grandis grandis]|uniref:uncharacterized protein LOC126742827 n=1 Tax=Anthonomus grandis grandis TaxID=2921223 RepID=UPI002165DF9C|nr:uncharacterized protein LOC126742827 [Anthonomus grandis grandis]
MTKVSHPSTHINTGFYLPHHAVLKESSTTTKLRVVFDGSAKSTSGLALNDTLKVGAKIQDDLIDIIIRFRTYRYGFTADIEKMYRSILVQENHRCFQKIIWRFDPSHELAEYQLNTVTYGTASASHLAIRCLRQLAIENQAQFPVASDKILKSFYVDDWLCGSNTIQEGKVLIKEVDEILKSAGFNLRKWFACDNTLLNNFSNSPLEAKILTENDTTKTLGITWNAKDDVFQYTICLPNINPVTKRSILASISQIFDPMGLVGPCIVRAKIIIQSLWQLGLNWDESVPMDLHQTWISFCEQICLINQIKIPRQIFCLNYNSVEFHGFSDASQKAYGACCYLKSCNNSGDVVVRLICAKSRIAPLKTLSLPRLELCGALLLIRLSSKVLNAIQHVKINHSYFWTDSSIVLSWLALEPSQLNTFVANRISEIQQSSILSQWRHVSTQQNPADMISRGLDPDTLKNCKLWWFGPEFLQHEEQTWPYLHSDISSNVPEVKQNTQTVLTTFENPIGTTALYVDCEGFVECKDWRSSVNSSKENEFVDSCQRRALCRTISTLMFNVTKAYHCE